MVSWFFLFYFSVEWVSSLFSRIRWSINGNTHNILMRLMFLNNLLFSVWHTIHQKFISILLRWHISFSQRTICEDKSVITFIAETLHAHTNTHDSIFMSHTYYFFIIHFILFRHKCISFRGGLIWFYFGWLYLYFCTAKMGHKKVL